jgi:hypothetical protein
MRRLYGLYLFAILRCQRFHSIHKACPFIFFIVAPCILKSIQFTHRQMHYLLNLERFQIYIKIHTKYRSYMFRSTTIIRELVLSLAKVILKHSVKLRRCMLFGDVAACHRASVCCVVCRMHSTQHNDALLCLSFFRVFCYI